MSSLDKKIDIILEKVIKILTEETDRNVPYVYHCARPQDIESIFSKGFRRFFFASNAGNFYGPGIYTTIDLDSSIRNSRSHTYGSVIIKSEFQSTKGYLIWIPEIAQRVYGQNWRIADQLRLIMPQNIIDEMRTINAQDGSSLYNYICQEGLSTQGTCAKALWEATRSNKFRSGDPFDYCTGFMFYGSSDGNVAVIREVTNAQPIEYSEDHGKTWKYGRNDRYEKQIEKDFDAEFKYGKKYSKVFPPKFGWSKVIKNDRVNYINKEGQEMSNTWFSHGSDFYEASEDFYVANVGYLEYSLILDYEGNVYSDIDSEYPECSAEDLPELVKEL